MKTMTIDGHVVIMDDSTYEWASLYSWHMRLGYIKCGWTPLHHCVIGRSLKGLRINFLNGNRLDVRRCNLAHRTRTEINNNRRCHREGTSYKAWRKKIMKGRIMSPKIQAKNIARANAFILNCFRNVKTRPKESP